MRFTWNGSPRLAHVLFLALLTTILSPVRPAHAQDTPTAPSAPNRSKDNGGSTAQGRGATPDKPSPAPPADEKKDTPTPPSVNRTPPPVSTANWWEDARTKVGVLAPVAQALLQLAQLVLTAVGLFAGALYLILIKHGLFPALQLRIEAASAEKSALVIRLTAENRSAVAARLKKGRSRRQILEYDISQMEESSTLEEWVPFYRWRQNNKAMEPIQWKDSARVMTSTICVEPGEVIRIELLHRIPNLPSVAIHCGFQVRTVPILAWLYFNKRRRVRRLAKRFLWNPTDRFTTTAWILVPTPSSQRSPQSPAVRLLDSQL